VAASPGGQTAGAVSLPTMSARVTLRPATEADLDYFDRAVGPDEDPWNFFGFRQPGRMRRAFAENGLLTEDYAQLVVAADGVLVGDVGWHKVLYGPPPAGGHAYNIGITLLPEHRGRGYGTIAQRLLADYLFATYAVNRLEAGTDVENRAEQRSLEKAGFTREGVARGSQFRHGTWHDLVIYSRLRGDD
jgi:RimJ/RimL family protein N-acetyltransferase